MGRLDVAFFQPYKECDVAAVLSRAYLGEQQLADFGQSNRPSSRRNAVNVALEQLLEFLLQAAYQEFVHASERLLCGCSYR